MPRLAGADTPAGTSFGLPEALAHPRELVGELHQRGPR
jgi:hypothetical protein